MPFIRSPRRKFWNFSVLEYNVTTSVDSTKVLEEGGSDISWGWLSGAKLSSNTHERNYDVQLYKKCHFVYWEWGDNLTSSCNFSVSTSEFFLQHVKYSLTYGLQYCMYSILYCMYSQLSESTLTATANHHMHQVCSTAACGNIFILWDGGWESMIRVQDFFYFFFTASIHLISKVLSGFEFFSLWASVGLTSRAAG